MRRPYLLIDRVGGEESPNIVPTNMKILKKRLFKSTSRAKKMKVQ